MTPAFLSLAAGMSSEHCRRQKRIACAVDSLKKRRLGISWGSLGSKPCRKIAREQTAVFASANEPKHTDLKSRHANLNKNLNLELDLFQGNDCLPRPIGLTVGLVVVEFQAVHSWEA